ncbi:hypothetical protein BpHYR1_018552 [Brachionus plicatilis]|uniref:Uncharacterized protein n=1 Tax=Brachionus plicatilis TaxID=10195 RepID=A0A3M7P944_BRAPC|nr:hypothetical protein BpHYR1_018552 [Brachionus plicatilis]
MSTTMFFLEKLVRVFIAVGVQKRNAKQENPNYCWSLGCILCLMGLWCNILIKNQLKFFKLKIKSRTISILKNHHHKFTEHRLVNFEI